MQGIAQILVALRLPAVLSLGGLLGACAQSSVPVTSNALAVSTTGGGSTTPSSPSDPITPAPPTTGVPPPPPPVTVPPTVVALTLSGTPAAGVVAGAAYAFTPTVSQSATIVAFSIANPPAWARFDTTTGYLGGTPTLANLGTTTAVVISATNGTSMARIGPFNVTVTAPAGSPPVTPTGTATLTWNAPLTNTDGTALLNLAGYHIHYGINASQLSTEITLEGGAPTTYAVDNLAAGTYYFAVTAFNTEGAESEPSNTVSKTL